SINTSSAPGQF
ncbi:unnamed protein product, partial [Penicillium rubens Wisconsin 54-1255]